MKHKTPSPAVLRSCTEAARAADAHAQESAKWAEEAKTANLYALRASYAAERAAQDATKTVRRLTIDVMLSAIAAAIALSVSVFALCHAS